ncbi:putative 2OG-Fe(II) oxygenase [Azospirillum sp. B4]|uniref:2OG-Fe(II) oxygenase family protein n=1 Tax=Azospirillum sp. B4 TaxID=95605 RepID=UPI0011DD96F0|nr:putative 2OG-Fe(II) oxygenase [Azospirillum sp. B4]
MKWLSYSPVIHSPVEALIDLYQSRAESQPNKPEPLFALASNLVAAGRPADALAALDIASSLPEGEPRATRQRIPILLRLGRQADVQLAVDRLPPEVRDADATCDLQVQALLHAGRPEDAARRFEAGAAGLPLRLWPNLALFQIFAGRLAVLLELMRAHPQAGTAAAVLDLEVAVLVALGRGEEARMLLGLPRGIARVDLGAELAARHSADAMAALEDELRAIPDLLWEPTGKSTRRGLQSYALLSGRHELIGSLLELIKTAVERHAQALPDDVHPFLRRRPVQARLAPWVVILNDGGYQSPHLHSQGWLSGTFYVRTPFPAGSLPVGRAPGALELGVAGYGQATPWTSTCLRSPPGELVLFPSFLRHGTQPNPPGADRISVAFDIIPTDAPALAVNRAA